MSVLPIPKSMRPIKFSWWIGKYKWCESAGYFSFEKYGTVITLGFYWGHLKHFWGIEYNTWHKKRLTIRKETNEH